ncbi:hypothetical protein CH063_01010 [Colletotrichum higginsianum]|uniref:Uncharacterized protein n=1 Tax=Colletotrichum higginsianum (strain IMI 349063) TaxID=759273 RepID=H1V0A8_COLHI|nr:hypothetical protein CH063_01010 [Colletotrichum higginsianum]
MLPSNPSRWGNPKPGLMRSHSPICSAIQPSSIRSFPHHYRVSRLQLPPLLQSCGVLACHHQQEGVKWRVKSGDIREACAQPASFRPPPTPVTSHFVLGSLPQSCLLGRVKSTLPLLPLLADGPPPMPSTPQPGPPSPIGSRVPTSAFQACKVPVLGTGRGWTGKAGRVGCLSLSLSPIPCRLCLNPFPSPLSVACALRGDRPLGILIAIPHAPQNGTMNCSPCHARGRPNPPDFVKTSPSVRCPPYRLGLG